MASRGSRIRDFVPDDRREIVEADVPAMLLNRGLVPRGNALDRFLDEANELLILGDPGNIRLGVVQWQRLRGDERR